jgi:hypothetical protein
MTVRAKFFVAAKNTTADRPNAVAECQSITFQVVYGDAPENKEWSKYTPWGKIEMGVTNPEAAAKFEVGKCYYVDFTPVEEKK